VPRLSLPLTLIVVLAFSTGCASIGEARSATVALFAATNEQAYGAIRSLMSRELSDRFDMEQTRRVFGRVRSEAGQCGVPSILGYNANYSAGGTRVTLTFSVRCRLTGLHGTLVWRVEGGETKISSFSIQRVVASSDEEAVTPPADVASSGANSDVI
jgi:hypothetical protein